MIAAFAAWWLVVVPPVNAAVLGGRGLAAGIRGEMVEGGDFLERAVAAEPNGFSPRFFLSSAWLNGAKRAVEPATRLTMLNTAYGIIGEVLERDPLNGRARIVLGEISRGIGGDDLTFVEQAIHDYELAIAVLPGLWEQREQMAWTFTALGYHERALEVVEEAKSLGAKNPEAYFLTFVEGKAWQGLGRDDEVDRIIALLRGIDSPLVVPLLEDLGADTPE